jgi:hypothetical protein
MRAVVRSSASVTEPTPTLLRVILFGVGVLALGFLAFLLWSWKTSRWPFGLQQAMS